MARTFTRTITTPAAARMVRPSGRPVVSLLTDFGSRDPSAGIMRAVVLAIAPDAIVTDISHEVEKYRVRDAALLLWCAVPYLSIGSHVAVVDPGVGTERRGIAMETARGDHLVGPDNGILLPAAARLGGIVRVHQLETAQYRLPIISSSFHGRDVFAPAAAHLAMGVPLEFLGPPVDPRSLRLLDWPEPEVYAGVLRSSVIYLDTFGNVKLSALGGHLLAALGELRLGERLYLRISDAQASTDVEVTWVEAFGRVAPGQPLLYEDSYGRLSLAVNQGSAVRELGIRDDAEVLVTRVPLPRPMVPDAQYPPQEAYGPPPDAPYPQPPDAPYPPPQGYAPPPDASYAPPPDAPYTPPQGYAPPPPDAPYPPPDAPYTPPQGYAPQPDAPYPPPDVPYTPPQGYAPQPPDTPYPPPDAQYPPPPDNPPGPESTADAPLQPDPAFPPYLWPANSTDAPSAEPPPEPTPQSSRRLRRRR